MPASPDFDGTFQSQFPYSILPAHVQLFAFSVFFSSYIFPLLFSLSTPEWGFCLLACLFVFLSHQLRKWPADDVTQCTRTKAWGGFLRIPRLLLPMPPLTRSSKVFLPPSTVCSGTGPPARSPGLDPLSLSLWGDETKSRFHCPGEDSGADTECDLEPRLVASRFLGSFLRSTTVNSPLNSASLGGYLGEVPAHRSRSSRMNCQGLP